MSYPKKKRDCAYGAIPRWLISHVMSLLDYLLSEFGFFLEIIFADTADGAYPVVWDILESCSGRDAAVGIACRGIVDPVAYCTSVFFHSQNVFNGFKIGFQYSKLPNHPFGLSGASKKLGFFWRIAFFFIILRLDSI